MPGRRGAQALLGPDKADDYERSPTSSTCGSIRARPTPSCWKAAAGPNCKWPADLYLEGSDQHRGWFQSSLLESCATRGRAPYKAVLTHGFTMDAKGMKMSKSLGNTVDPAQGDGGTYGADIIRLWALSVDYTEDHRIGDEILKGVADQYRKLRNTFRYLLGALDGFSEERAVPTCRPRCPSWSATCSRCWRARRDAAAAVADFDFNTYVRALSDFCNEDLSAFFFDIRKDCLYCDAPGDPKRRAYRTVLDTCSTPWSATPRRCWCSPPRKCGARAIPRGQRAPAGMAGGAGQWMRAKAFLQANGAKGSGPGKVGDNCATRAR
jgi:isoleucyl-tRNA synthetase